MESPSSTISTDQPPAPQWQPISAVERRILGVLVEKAKTTPDAYPMTLNALTTGCNQKNNRDPQMQLASEDVADGLDRLRGLNAVVEVHGDSRVARYKHRMYEWLGVDKVEMAVMAELLLRGAQTIGELRGRAARMEPIADLAALRPVVDSLKNKGLVAYLTPQQRGAVVTHLLYKPEELEKVRRLLAESGGDWQDEPAAAPTRSVSEAATGHSPPPRSANELSTSSPLQGAELTAMKDQLRDLSAHVAQLQSALDTATGDLRRDIEDIRRQLGM